jgi:hypothetical protein
VDNLVISWMRKVLCLDFLEKRETRSAASPNSLRFALASGCVCGAGGWRTANQTILPQNCLTHAKMYGLVRDHYRSCVKALKELIHKNLMSFRTMGTFLVPLSTRCLVVASAMLFLISPGKSITCFSSADQVRQEKPGAWPTWTLRAPGHEGSRCWYASTGAAARDHRNALRAEPEPVSSESPSEGTTFELPVPTLSPEVLEPTQGSSFEDRFSAVLKGASGDAAPNFQRVIDLFRSLRSAD